MVRLFPRDRNFLREHRIPCVPPLPRISHLVPFRPLHLFESWSPVVSGYAQRSRALIQAQLAHGGFEPRALVTSRQFTYGAASVEPLEGLGERLRLCRPSPWERWWRGLRPFTLDTRALERHLEQALDDWGADLVHVHWSSGIGQAAARVAQRRGLPVVAEVRFDLASAATSQWLGTSWPRLEALLRRRFESHLGNAAAIIAAGPALTRFLQETFPSLRERIWTVSNGVEGVRPMCVARDEAWRHAHGLAGGVVVGSTSNMLHYEGLDTLVRSLAQARTELPALQGLLVGGGPEEERLRRLANEWKVPVVLTGRVPHGEIPGLLAQIDLFVIPRRDLPITRYAGPLKLVEALAAGRAIIATGLGDIPDLMADGAGVLLPGDSVDDLAKALVRWGRDTEGRTRLGDRARARLPNLPTWTLAAQQHAEIYRQALAR